MIKGTFDLLNRAAPHLQIYTHTCRFHEDAQGALVVCGAPRSEDPDLAHALMSPSSFRPIVERLLKRPQATLSALKGRFALIWCDYANGVLGMATDRFNTFPLCWTQRGQIIAFSNRADSVAVEDRRVDPQALFDYLYSHVIPSPRTVFKDVKRLAPASLLIASQSEVTEQTWWRPVFEDSRSASVAELQDEFLSLIEQAVQREAANESVGTFLSGGTDSSTVTGMLCKIHPHAKAYSIGFEAQGYDEMEFARIAAKHFGADHQAYYVTPDDLVAGIPSVAAHYDQPFGNSSALPAYYCAKRAHDEGITKLLAGDGGDELFGGNTRYAKQRVFGWYEKFPMLLRQHMLEPVLSGSWANQMPGIKKIASYVEQARVPLPDRIEQYNLLYRLGLQNIFTPTFLEQVDCEAPLNLKRNVYKSIQACSQLNRMLGFDWRFTLAENDLPKVIGTTRLAQIGVAFPFLSDEMVDFSLRLPTAYKLKGLKLRWFFKHALRNFLPAEILTKRKQGFGLPFGHWALQHAGLNKLAKESLDNLAQRGVLRPDFLRQLFVQHLPSHPGYYGEMVWISMMLEQWLNAKVPEFELK